MNFLYSCQPVNWLIAIFLLMMTGLVQAQPEKTDSKAASVEYRQHEGYYERITYLNKLHDKMLVHTYLNDSTLYRVDSYLIMPQGRPFNLIAYRHGPAKVLYANGRLYLTCDYNQGELNGGFMVYYPDGSIKRRALYRHGRLKKNTCYSTDGSEQTCDAFYQQAQFVGNQKELKDYLRTRLSPLMDASPARSVKIRLLISEIGQVLGTDVEADANGGRLASGVRSIIQDMPRWREGEFNWKPAVIDGTPIAESWTMYVYRDRGYMQITLP